MSADATESQAAPGDEQRGPTAETPPVVATPSTGAHAHHSHEPPRGRRLAILSLGALGVVFGDIGTSPLYALKECFKAEYGLVVNPRTVYGVLSLIVWSLVLIVAVKYVAFILRADNRGEGGVLALLALVLQRQHRTADARQRKVLIALGLFGGAFLYGDGVITPAISVLGAVEGLEVSAPAMRPFVIPLAVFIIAVLFFVQKKGTAKVGSTFGWVMLVWFTAIAALGVAEIVAQPEILHAVNPWYGVRFFLDHPMRSFVVLGAVVLVVTGGEALYADMGHFGKRPIRLVWFSLVLPALLLNYFGQGALLLSDPRAVENPFYLLAPRWFLIPLLVIATAAAVVASQALISGAFSLTQQAAQLGYTPRVNIVHTSTEQAGQIYIPEVNHALAVGTLLLVVSFGSSTALGAAYGVAVTGTMAITNVLFYFVARAQLGWSRPRAAAFLTFFMIIDLAFFSANLLKIPSGGWVPLAIAAVIFTLMTTWARGRAVLRQIMNRASLPTNLLLEDIARREPVRVSGTAIFLTSSADGAPVVLMHHLKHNKVLHERVVLLSIFTTEVPEVPAAERVQVEELGQGFYRATARYGFMETPNVAHVLPRCAEMGCLPRPHDVSYFLGRERLIPTGTAPMAGWRKKLFILMSRNARSAADYFGIPPNRVVELGAQIEF